MLCRIKCKKYDLKYNVEFWREWNYIPHPQLNVKTSSTQANLYPQFFEEKESFGFNVADVIAQRVNDAYKAAGAKVERIARYIQERTKL